MLLGVRWLATVREITTVRCLTTSSHCNRIMKAGETKAGSRGERKQSCNVALDKFFMLLCDSLVCCWLETESLKKVIVALVHRDAVGPKTLHNLYMINIGQSKFRERCGGLKVRWRLAVLIIISLQVLNKAASCCCASVWGEITTVSTNCL
jgi:hypothetical protein